MGFPGVVSQQRKRLDRLATAADLQEFRMRSLTVRHVPLPAMRSITLPSFSEHVGIGPIHRRMRRWTACARNTPLASPAQLMRRANGAFVYRERCFVFRGRQQPLNSQIRHPRTRKNRSNRLEDITRVSLDSIVLAYHTSSKHDHTNQMQRIFSPKTFKETARVSTTHTNSPQNLCD